MALYLMLTTLTEKGVQTLNSNPARLREVNRDVEELGARILHQWASLGEYDFVNVVEAPDDLTIARVSVALGARGSSKIESLPLVSVDDLLASLAGLGSPAERAAARISVECGRRQVVALAGERSSASSRGWPRSSRSAPGRWDERVLVALPDPGRDRDRRPGRSPTACP